MNEVDPKPGSLNRRQFLKSVVRGGILVALTGFSGIMLKKWLGSPECRKGYACGRCTLAEQCALPEAEEFRQNHPEIRKQGTMTGQTVWQLDPSKCIQCGRCATNCVLEQSAVRCTHVFAMCGYCDLCGGYFKPGAKNLDTAAENQLCPTHAIRRKFVEDPFFEYTIDEPLCIGCGKCVKGCSAFGNGSLQLQVRQDLCQQCNQCSIARSCPSGAFTRVPASRPYLLVDVSGKPIETR
jgi:Na+-translocating ferredoxin:NAD+ oxidoreductase subunit B